MIRILMPICLSLLLSNSMQAQGADAITGLWRTPGDQAIVRIEYRNGQLTGRIVQVHPAGYINGASPKDVHNENVRQRSRSLEGVAILSGISYNSRKKTWTVQKLYDPQRGKYFEGHIELEASGMLKLRGHLPGKKWLGENQIWKPYREGDPFG